MTRKDALVRLHERLLMQRDELKRKIADDLGLTSIPDDGINDIGEAALQMESSELYSQLAQLESRELVQIDLAIDKIRQGTYGKCDRCGKSIPLARLKAVPYSSFCVGCQEKREQRGLSGHDYEADWSSAMDYERRHSDPEYDLSDLDVSTYES